MAVTRYKCRVIGVQLGEATLNFILPKAPPLTAVFALVREDGELAGRIEKRLEWSDKTLQDLATLRQSMERDIMSALFELPPDWVEDPKDLEDGEETPQV